MKLTLNQSLSYENVIRTGSLTKNIVLVLVGAILIAVSAQFTFPAWPVPVSGQTLGVMMVAALLGSRRGVISVLTYLTAGVSGLPVFVGGTSGLLKLTGPTSGYLFGFIAAAWVIGFLFEKGWNKNLFLSMSAFGMGSVAIYVVGLTWLTVFTGIGSVLKLGLLPFISGDIIKIVCASFVVTGLNHLNKK